MLRFKGFLVENADAIASVQNMVSSLTGIQSGKPEAYEKKSSGKRIGAVVVLPDKQRKEFVAKANQWLKSAPGYEYLEITSGRASKDVHFKHKDVPEKSIYLVTKPDGARGRTDPNELMSAVIACMPNIKIPADIEELDMMIDAAKKLVSSKVEDYSQNELDAFDYEYSNFCQAISAAIGIQKHIGGKADKAYVTGRTWHKDIAKFKLNAYGMKDFNSSDIVFKRNNKYYGVSLKKKQRPTTADPTLLNKTMGNLLSTPKLQTDYRTAVDGFLDKVIVAAQKAGMVNDKDFKNRKTAKVRKKIITGLDEKWMGAQLKAEGSIFTAITNILEKDAEIIAEKLVQLVFKLDLNKLKEHDFDFSLITGIGDYGPKKGPVISKADIYDLDTITKKMHDLLAKEKPHVVIDTTSIQPGQTGATAAVLKCFLTVGKMKVVNLAIRYKGSSSWTSQPSVTGNFTSEFSKFFKAT